MLCDRCNCGFIKLHHQCVWTITSQCYRVQDNGQLLRIVDAQLLDIGSYFCLATNPAGNATKAFSLSVLGMNELKVMCIEALYSISIFSICCVLYRNFGWNLNAGLSCSDSLYN